MVVEHFRLSHTEHCTYTENCNGFILRTTTCDVGNTSLEKRFGKIATSKGIAIAYALDIRSKCNRRFIVLVHLVASLLSKML